MNPCGLTASVTAIANALACKLTVNELSLLASVLSQLGDTLNTIATLRSICEDNDNDNEETVYLPLGDSVKQSL